MSRSRGMRYIPSVFLPKSSSTWTDPELPAAMCQWGKALLHSANATCARSLGFDNSACFYIVLVMVGLTIRDIAPRPHMGVSENSGTPKSSILIVFIYCTCTICEKLSSHPGFGTPYGAPKPCKTWPRLVHTAHRRSKKGPLFCIGQSLRQGKRGADHWRFCKGYSTQGSLMLEGSSLMLLMLDMCMLNRHQSYRPNNCHNWNHFFTIGI